MKTLCKRIIILILVFMTLSSTLLPTNVLQASNYANRPTQADDIQVRGNFLKDLGTEKIEINGEEYYKFTVSESGVYQISNEYGTSSKSIYQSVGGKLVSTKNGATNTRYILDSDTTYYVKVKGCNENTIYILYGKIAKEATEKETFFETVEHWIAWLIRTTANGLVGLIRWATGGDAVTIDKIIFNEYKPTKLVYFSEERNQLKEGATDTRVNDNYEYPIVHAIANSITEWFNIFRAIAIVGYTAILLYIGIQILLKSTAEKQAEYKRLLMDWVVGILLLFMFPTVIKTAIEINNSLVETIGSERGTANADGEVLYTEKKYYPIDSYATEEEVKNFTANFDESPFDEASNDYMAIMSKKAEKTEQISYAILYMIMAWQLLMLIIMYYKRLFMVGFLLVLFPLVALTYALDKIKDGKSQAFNTWGKEILLNIFIQTFHAIIYVFALGVTFTASETSNDWILMIMGVSFLFKGEEIIKKIFGFGSSDSIKSLAETATKAYATFSVVKRGALGIKDNFIGKNSHLGKAIGARRSARTYAMMADNFDAFATTPAYTPPPASSLPHAPSIMTPDATDLGNAIQTLNHFTVASLDQLADALNKVQKYFKTGGPNMAMLADLKLTRAQIRGLEDVRRNAIQSINNGEQTASIVAKMKLELETLIPGKDIDAMQQAIYRQMAMPLNTNHLGRNTYMGTIRREIMDAHTRKREIEDSIDFRISGRRNLTDLAADASDLACQVYGRNITDANTLEMAGYIQMLRQRDSGDFSAKQLTEAAQYINEHRFDSLEYGQMIGRLDYDFDEIRHVLAEKTIDTFVNSDGTYKTIVGAYAFEQAEFADACVAAREIKDNIENREGRIRTERTSLLYGSTNFNEEEPALFASSVTTILEDVYGIRPYTDEEIKMAECIEKLDQRYSGSYTQDAIIEAYNYLNDHRNDTADIRNLVENRFGNASDVDDLGNALKGQVSDSWYSNQDIDEVSVNTLIRNSHSFGLSDDDLATRIQSMRLAQNDKEREAAKKFAKEVMEKEVLTINGMTENDLRELANIEKHNATKETLRTVVTTEAAVLGMPIGAAAGIAFMEGDGDNPLGEAIVGASAGAAVMDTIAERATTGNSKVKKTYVLRNPYTGEDEAVTLMVSGAFNERIYSFEDPGLPKDVSDSIREQFIASKVKKQKEKEAAKQKKIDKEKP